MSISEKPVIIVVNAGSSSIKLSIYTLSDNESPRLAAHGKLEGIGSHPELNAQLADGTNIANEEFSEQDVPDHHAAYGKVREVIKAELEDMTPVAVGHRIVHGGMTFSEPVAIDGAIREQLEALIPLAPLHQPHNLAGIDAVSKIAPDILQVACFDNAFHHDRPEVSQLTGLPYRYYQQGLRRYGFHGLSYEYIAKVLPEIDPALARGKVIVAHLGNGASLCALDNCKSVETTMSFTALDGLPMGTRCGALDPGALLFLQQQHELSDDELQALLYQQSGLKGLSGISSDMEELLASDEEGARRAIDFFVYRAAQAFGALAVALGGLDGVVFTGGIGEHAAPIRRAIVNKLAALFPMCLDDAANQANDPALISSEGSRVQVRVIPTDEEGMLAEHTWRLWRAARM
ncbi:acetate/propionate family kinase [Phytohalomonas tamaricis]|uniref:acetate/propionate family kinase n=1 Tax=Phytohalomonas tamaricis TaxID=2081032 RepID=UPI000D0AD0A0|nr:acetate/propionate family kinase [Phytohalomonas tamaricis]